MDWSDLDFIVALTGSHPNNTLQELHWCAFDLKNSVATSESSSFIGSDDESESLSQALRRFNQFVYENMILQNCNFCLICDGDELINSILPQECNKEGIRLAPHFSKFFDIRREFENFYPDVEAGDSLVEMLAVLGLTDNTEELDKLQECSAIIRIVNKMTKEGHKFSNPLDLNIQPAPTPVAPPPRSPSPLTPPMAPQNPVLNLKIQGLPKSYTEQEVLEFLYGIKVDKVIPEIMPDGAKSGTFYVKCWTEEDFLEALTYDQRKIKRRTVSINSCSDGEFETAEKNQTIGAMQGKCVKGALDGCLQYYIEDTVYSIVPEDQIQSYMQILDGTDLNQLLCPKYYDKNLEITNEQKTRAVILRGFPLNIKRAEIVEFLRDFEVHDKDVYIKRDGVERGWAEAVAVFMTTEERDRVLRTLSNKLFQGKFIEIYRLQRI